MFIHRNYICNFEPIRCACILPKLSFAVTSTDFKLCIYDLRDECATLHQTLQIPMIIKMFPNKSETVLACQIVSEHNPSLFSIRLICFKFGVATLWQLSDDDTQFTINSSNVWLNDFAFVIFRRNDIRLIIINETYSCYRSYSCLVLTSVKMPTLLESLSSTISGDIINWTSHRGFAFLLCVRCKKNNCNKVHFVEQWEVKGSKLTRGGTIHSPSPILSFKMISNLGQYAMLCCMDFTSLDLPINNPCPMELDYSDYKGTCFFTGYFNTFLEHNLLKSKIEDWNWSAVNDALYEDDWVTVDRGIPLAFDQLWDFTDTQICWLDRRAKTYTVAVCIPPRIRNDELVFLQHQVDFSNMSDELLYSGDIFMSRNEQYVFFTANDFTSLIISKLHYRGNVTFDQRSMLLVKDFVRQPADARIVF